MIEARIIRLTFVDAARRHNKDYHCLILEDTRTNRAVLMRRWGAIGSVGQFKTQNFDNPRAADKYVSKLVDSKVDEGYSKERDDLFQASTLNEALDQVSDGSWTPTVSTLNAGNLVWLGISAEEASDPIGTGLNTPGPKVPKAPEEKKPDTYGTW